jgi:hypothetical protein
MCILHSLKLSLIKRIRGTSCAVNLSGVWHCGWIPQTTYCACQPHDGAAVTRIGPAVNSQMQLSVRRAIARPLNCRPTSPRPIPAILTFCVHLAPQRKAYRMNTVNTVVVYRNALCILESERSVYVRWADPTITNSARGWLWYTCLP